MKLDRIKYSIKINFLLIIIIALVANRCKGMNNHSSKTLTGKSLNQLTDTIYLINKTTQEFGFYYENKFLDRIQFHLLPNSIYKIVPGDNIQMIKQTNNNQNFYVLYPNDTLYTSVAAKGDAIFFVKNDQIRNNELNLQWKINEGTSLNFMKILYLREQYFNSDYEKMDSIYKVDYNSKINFINTYKTLHPISMKYEKLLKNYYKTLLLLNQLWMGTTSKSKIDRTYIDFLCSLKDSIRAIISSTEKPLNSFLQFGYERFKLRELANNPNYYDSLYIHCRYNIRKEVSAIVLFNIIKQALEKDPAEKWFVRDFIDNIASKDYKSYIKNLIENDSIMVSGSSKNNLINAQNRIFSYDSLINSLNKNAIYIDIWASWCKPCRSEMPFSASLRKKYKNKNIRFIYLSIDNNIGTWKNANQEVGLGRYSDSYLLLNAQKSDFIKKFKISSIPRYILIAQHGRIQNKNALRPSDQELTKIFDSLINDE